MDNWNFINEIQGPPLHELAAEFVQTRRQTEASPVGLEITKTITY
jgi:hypothetical protein